MSNIPLGLNAYNRDNMGLPPVELINLFIEEDNSDASIDEKAVLHLQRPGTVNYATVAGSVRGMYQSDGVEGGKTFVAAGAKLQTITSTSTANVGDIASDGQSVAFAASFDKLALTSAGKLYMVRSGALSEIAMPDSRTAIDVTAIANFIIVATPDGRWFYIPPGIYDLTTGTHALNFFTAESAADGLVAVETLNDDLYLFGTSTVEVWQPTGAASPFQRASGRGFSRGCMSRESIKTVDNTLFFVGNNGVVYRAAAVPQRVSTATIEEHIAKRSGTVSAFVYTLDAHEFYCLKIPGRGTFAYDASTKGWSRLKSYNQTEFTPAFSVLTNDGWLLGDTVSAAVVRMDRNASTDRGQPLERIVTATVPLPSRRSTRNDSIALYVGSSVACSYRLRWHDGQGGAYPSTYRALKARAGADVLTTYRLGHGRESYRTFEVSIVDPAIIRISAMKANESFD